MRRRHFIQATALAAALAAGGLAAIQPRSTVWPRIGKGNLATVEGRRRVSVVGGGLAGIAAACTLAERGYQVTLYERGTALGGKLAGWPVRVAGEEVPMEHGFHGFFTQYYNLQRLLAEARADRDMLPQRAYPILFRDRPAEMFTSSKAPFPVNLLSVLAGSQSLGLGDVAGDRPAMNALLGYDPIATFAAWDHLDSETFLRQGSLEGAFADVVFRPFARASMNALSGFSAAEAIRFFHFYMLGNPEGLGFSALGRGVHVSVLEPLAARLAALGVQVRTGADVRRVVIQEGRARGIELAAPGSGVLTLPVDAVPGQGWVGVGDGRAFVRRTGSGFEARDSRCSHMACPVLLAADGFQCPCHAGRYDADANPVSGPPPRALANLEVVQVGDQLRVSLPGDGGVFEESDAVVIATEVRGFRALAAASDFATHAPALHRSAEAAGEADAYAVVRWWFDRPVAPDRAAFYTVSEFEWTDSIGVYSAFQAPFTARAHEQAVVESHAYAIPRDRLGTVDDHAGHLLAELRVAFPELADARVVHQEAMTQSNFTRFAPGDFARRPEVHTEIPNLYIAGDHVQLPFPAFLMEAAVSSGRLAANHICAADGVTEVPIHTVALRGQLAGL